MLLLVALSAASSLVPMPALVGEPARTLITGAAHTRVKSRAAVLMADVKAGAQITYQCKAGTCASCEVNLGGKSVRTCQTKVQKPWFGDTVTVTAKAGSATRL
ncbi:hypothetical protein AB1Y20_021265 [Prymnesium parvum]|uniref:2Fe-2S ferredoxin-type domain-containing protein n=1 Tax=Prymnesium parvum TaxID=97485 RepID=A0AB34JJM4_PRYPA